MLCKLRLIMYVWQSAVPGIALLRPRMLDREETARMIENVSLMRGWVDLVNMTAR